MANQRNIQILDVEHEPINGFVSGPLPLSISPSPSPLRGPDTQASPSDAPLDLSKDKVNHLNYYEEEMHRDIMALVRGVRNEEPTVSAPDLFTHKDLVDAVAEVRKSICHYK